MKYIVVPCFNFKKCKQMIDRTEGALNRIKKMKLRVLCYECRELEMQKYNKKRNKKMMQVWKDFKKNEVKT